MATKTNTTTDRQAIANEIAAQMLARLNQKTSSNLTILQRLNQAAADRIADAGEGVGEIVEGFKALQTNFALHRESAAQRQALRTQAKINRLVELEMQARGL